MKFHTKKSQPQAEQPLILVVGNDEITITKRYKVLSIINDFLVALWFLVGSIFFLYSSSEILGVYLFILGSAQLLIRSIIGLTSFIHIGHIQKKSGSDNKFKNEDIANLSVKSKMNSNE